MTARHFNWSFPPAECVLSAEEVHVWVADIEQDSQLINWAQTLSPDEEARAARFHFNRDRKNFTAARGILRAILSCYTKLDAEKICFEYNANGKPSFSSASQFGNLAFNLTHSGGLALYAIARNRQLGIDLEPVRVLPDMDEIAMRCFLPEEQSILKFLNAPQKAENFFRCWTRKEAQLKCSGSGFSSTSVRENHFQGTLLELAPAEGFLGALAVQGQPFSLRTWQWRG
ncbi:MAG: 4'-phosphopantetheinyl transferase superfamily protein [Verrucomicrobiota bacterium]